MFWCSCSCQGVLDSLTVTQAGDLLASGVSSHTHMLNCMKHMRAHVDTPTNLVSIAVHVPCKMHVCMMPYCHTLQPYTLSSNQQLLSTASSWFEFHHAGFGYRYILICFAHALHIYTVVEQHCCATCTHGALHPLISWLCMLSWLPSWSSMELTGRGHMRTSPSECTKACHRECKHNHVKQFEAA